MLLCGALLCMTDAIAEGALILTEETISNCARAMPITTSDSGVNAWGYPNTGGTGAMLYTGGGCTTHYLTENNKWNRGSYTLKDHTMYQFCADNISNTANQYCSSTDPKTVITGIIIFTTVNKHSVVSDCFPITGCSTSSCSSCIYSGNGQNFVMK